MREMHFKSKIAQLSLSDLRRKPSVGQDQITND